MECLRNDYTFGLGPRDSRSGPSLSRKIALYAETVLWIRGNAGRQPESWREPEVMLDERIAKMISAMGEYIARLPK